MITKSNGGFTLIELMLVIAIIGILGNLAIVKGGSILPSARDARRIKDLQTLFTSIEMYRLTTGEYPGWGYCDNAPSFLNYSTCSNGSWGMNSDDLGGIMASAYMGGRLPRDPLNIGSPYGEGAHLYMYEAYVDESQTFVVCTNLEVKKPPVGGWQNGGFNYCLRGGCEDCHNGPGELGVFLRT